MNLKHLNLTVTDVRAASAFLERYFGLRSTGGNAGMAFLMDEDNFVLSPTDRAGHPPQRVGGRGAGEVAHSPIETHIRVNLGQHQSATDRR